MSAVRLISHFFDEHLPAFCHDLEIGRTERIRGLLGQEIVTGLADQLFSGQGEHGFESTVDQQEPPFRILNVNKRWGAIENGLQLLL